MSGARRGVLVVEDDADIADTVCCVLEHAGYDPHRAGNGREALALARAHSFRLALVDWWLPGDPCGGALVAALREACGAELRIVAYSAAPDALTEARRAEVASVLRKPFELRELLEVVERSS